MHTTSNTAVASTAKAKWTYKDFTWALSLFGTAVGAGVLFLPIKAGAGGFWPLVILALIAAPMTWFAHKSLARFVLSAKNPEADITDTVEEHFGKAGANIISMSLGGGGSNSTESNAFQAFSDAGGLVLAAAGNDGNNVRSYPAGYPSVMMIGANDADNNIASFSQYPSCTTTSGKGKRATTTTDETICVEATAGGVDTLSTYPAGMATC